MHKRFEYQSVLAPYIRDFIHMKESSGCNYLRGKWILNEFDQFFLQKNITEPSLTREIVLDWHKTRINDSPATIYSKYSTLNQLARYMSPRDVTVLSRDCLNQRVQKATLPLTSLLTIR